MSSEALSAEISAEQIIEYIQKVNRIMHSSREKKHYEYSLEDFEAFIKDNSSKIKETIRVGENPRKNF